MNYKKILQRFWKDYVNMNPHAKTIYHALEEQGEQVINDHIALRTFNDSRVDINKLAHYFIADGYIEKNEYHFEAKKLYAKHFEHVADEKAPKIFISELLLEEFSDELQEICTQCIDRIPENILNSEQLLFSKVNWKPLQYSTYQQLLNESEYAAWMYAFGFCANHFTVNLNELKQFNEISEINSFIKQLGLQLNSSGGEVKGTPADFLEQSSTLAGEIEVKFAEGMKTIPSCYYEFAKRYPLENGKLYTGFVAASADKIFESTDSKK